ncbi:hypothetical protein GAGA_0167 [Paraglaciecola agarilytica NO2]|uniref:Uncharacterized protein n=1 Tax=Paraglaciecola agarilytica NO2 TaxID=1125747 RepID=A0ABQ0I129_9ALTE|nr:hypothetical protein GAGA_0167 [Paraglaciecola agarilytica NO2]
MLPWIEVVTDKASDTILALYLSWLGDYQRHTHDVKETNHAIDKAKR